MKQTRNLFILTGAAPDVSKVIAELQFKGTTIIDNPISYGSALEVFNNNKSIICSSELAGIEKLHESPIYIEVTNNSNHAFSDFIDTNNGDIVTQFQNIADKHNCDIGDHKSNSSGLNGTSGTQYCTYCKSFASGKEKTIYKSANFYVIATLGEFIVGYLLIIPAKHIMSIAQLTSSEREEFFEVLNDVKYLLNLTYNTSYFLVWENGTGNSGTGKAKDSIVHAHVHIAPSMLTPETVQKDYGLYLKQICPENLPHYSKHSYLLIRGNDDNTWFINDNPNVYIPRQFIRQILAEEHHITPSEAWNWRTFPFRELMKKTQEDIFTALKNNWENIPDRIKTNTEKYVID